MVKKPPTVESLEDYDRIFDIFYTLKEELEQKGVNVDYTKPDKLKFKDEYKQEILYLSKALSTALEKEEYG